jgi:hypothetical protein
MQKRAKIDKSHVNVFAAFQWYLSKKHFNISNLVYKSMLTMVHVFNIGLAGIDSFSVIQAALMSHIISFR